MQKLRKSPTGGKKIVITSVLDDSNTVLVGVCDNGIGAADEIISDIFEPFFSTRSDGLGMGLAICKTILDSHFGQIETMANPDAGLTVLFRIPATK